MSFGNAGLPRPVRQVQHFKRAIAMQAAISAVMTQHPRDMLAQRAALEALGPYRSRGHGLGLARNLHSRHHVASDKRAAQKRRNVMRNRRAHR